MRRLRTVKIVGRLSKTPPDQNWRFAETPYKPAPLSRVFASIAKPITNHNLKNPFLKITNEKSFNCSDHAAFLGEHRVGAERFVSRVKNRAVRYRHSGNGMY